MLENISMKRIMVWLLNEDGLKENSLADGIWIINIIMAQ